MATELLSSEVEPIIDFFFMTEAPKEEAAKEETAEGATGEVPAEDAGEESKKEETAVGEVSLCETVGRRQRARV